MIPPRIIANLDQFGYLYAFAVCTMAVAWAPSLLRVLRGLARKRRAW